MRLYKYVNHLLHKKYCCPKLVIRKTVKLKKSLITGTKTDRMNCWAELENLLIQLVFITVHVQDYIFISVKLKPYKDRLIRFYLPEVVCLDRSWNIQHWTLNLL